jgi:hypothetical protein
MSTVEPRPVKAKKPLNPSMLTIAAILLIVLALLFLASPLLGLNQVGGRGGNFNRQFTGQNGQNFPGFNPNGGTTGTGGTGGTGGFGGTGGTGGGSNGFRFQGGTPGQTPTRTSLVGLNFLRGTLATVIYGIALLISLAAVIGMLSVKRWGKILGIVMAVVYLLLAVLTFLPTILLARFGAAFSNPLSLVLNGLHLLLALGVIIFASIPAKNLAAPVTLETPPATTA